MVEASDIVAFWRAAGPKLWFAKDDAFDAEIGARFAPTHHLAAGGDRDDWSTTAEGALALLLLFDQFPRNLWRNSPHAFATDPLARNLARQAIQAGQDRVFGNELRQFFCLPFGHSESLAEQDFGVQCCEASGRETGEDDAKWARIHRDVIVRFGRFPHRNRALGRTTTVQEQAFLDAGGFAG